MTHSPAEAPRTRRAIPLGAHHERDAEQHLNRARASLRAAMSSAEAAGYGDQFRGSLDEAIKHVEYTQGMLV